MVTRGSDHETPRPTKIYSPSEDSVSNLCAIGCEIDVFPATPGNRAKRGRKTPLFRESIKALVTGMTWIDVEDDGVAAEASRNTDRGVRIFSPPVLDR